MASDSLEILAVLYSGLEPLELLDVISSMVKLLQPRPVNPVVPVMMSGRLGTENQGSCVKVECPGNPRFVLVKWKGVSKGARKVLRPPVKGCPLVKWTLYRGECHSAERHHQSPASTGEGDGPPRWSLTETTGKGSGHSSLLARGWTPLWRC